MMEELNVTALKLEVGQYSGIIETSVGYFILMKTDEKSFTEYDKMKQEEARWETLMQHAKQLYEKGEYGVATSVAQEALRIAETTLGLADPKTGTSINNLALLYDSQGKYAEAEPLYKRALEIREKVLGSDHPDVAQS
ncbi:MAG: tetratricopeptide repeat protein, partial [candidate division Zixibacteria bacterium]|nr:tetratricopeptide repeat protein [candidate division Zixibacteria bacterium]